MEPHLLQQASKKLRHDFDVVRQAVQKDGMCLEYAAEPLKSNDKIVKEAVLQNGLALGFAASSLKANMDIVALAIKKNGLALQFASDQLKADKRVVLRALQFDGMALQFASERLRAEKGVVLRALKENHRAWAFAGESLKRDPEFSNKRLQRQMAIQYDIHIPTELATPTHQTAESGSFQERTGKISVFGGKPIRVPSTPVQLPALANAPSGRPSSSASGAGMPRMHSRSSPSLHGVSSPKNW
mmetsp:Transcript_135996/g.379029  ORF Transcript_135996/g.379029 Transcript_135996/m.379029 type:complete len:243 (-) Transcript_135996:138-866(-)